MDRLRGIKAAYDEIKATDPATAVSEYYIRTLQYTHPELFIRAGRRVLCNLSKLEAFLSNPQPAAPEPSKIRRIL